MGAMRKLAAVAVLAVVLGARFAPQDPQPDPATLHRAKQLSMVDEHHARLQKLVGEWDVVLRTAGPAGAPQEDRGRVAAAAILGGRYVVANYTLGIQGAKVEAVQIFGFDTLRQLYAASWRDSLSTWSVECAGTPAPPEGAEVVTMAGTLVDARDPTGRPFRQVLDLTDAKTVTVRLFDTRDGKESEVQVQQWTKR